MSEVLHNKSLLIRQGPTKKEGKRVYFEGSISDSSLDSHNTRMTKKALEQYAQAADSEIIVLPEHNRMGQPIGRSTSGHYNRKTGEVTAEFYIQRGLDLDGAGYANTDSYIDSMEEGTTRDLSIGARIHKMTCDECHEDMKPDPYWGWIMPKCKKNHFPGKRITDRKTKRERIVTASIVDAELSEFSVVSSGANKNAKIIQKAKEASEKGVLTDEHIDRLGHMFDISRSDLDFDPTLAGEKHMATDKDLKDQDQDESQDKPESTELLDLRAENETLRSDLGEVNKLLAEYEDETEDRIEQIQRLKDEVGQVKELKADNEALTQDLEDKDAEIEKLQGRIDRNRKSEDYAERYQDLLDDARDEYMRAYVRAKGVKTTSDAADAERARIDKSENYDLIASKTRKLRFEYAEETSAVKERRKAERKRADDIDRYDI